MRLFGLIGKQLGHSLSAKWFNDFFKKNDIDAEYKIFDIPDIDLVKEIIKDNRELEGLNVTIPYKKEILSLCTSNSEEVKKTGSANCLLLRGDNIFSYNTDIDGFAETINLISNYHFIKGAMILGTGGAASAAGYVLRNKNVRHIYISRTKNGKNVLKYDQISKELLCEYPLIINATPVGMYPRTDAKPTIPYNLLSGNEFLFDMIYNPVETLFLKTGKRYGCKVVNGMPMLIKQAERSWEIWNSK